MITDVQKAALNILRVLIISYSDYSKINILNIKKEKIKRFGAVSSSVCYDMAFNAKKIFKSDFSIAVTGYAGPDISSDQTGLGFCHMLGPER
jgi:PncC family amidohydrolase